MRDRLKAFYFNYLWWIWQTILVFLMIFFFILGVQVFIKAYQLKNPFDFILTFFASNLMILISGVLVVGLIYRMIGVYRLVCRKKGQEEKNDPS
jgi:hypothetical protein